MYNFWGDFILVYFSILWRGFYRTIIILIMLAGHELSATCLIGYVPMIQHPIQACGITVEYVKLFSHFYWFLPNA